MKKGIYFTLVLFESTHSTLFQRIWDFQSLQRLFGFISLVFMISSFLFLLDQTNIFQWRMFLIELIDISFPTNICQDSLKTLLKSSILSSGVFKIIRLNSSFFLFVSITTTNIMFVKHL